MMLQLLLLLFAIHPSAAQWPMRQVIRGAQQSDVFHVGDNLFGWELAESEGADSHHLDAAAPFPYCSLIEPKRTNFGGLELVRSCGIIDFQTLVDWNVFPPVGFSCADLDVPQPIPKQEPLVNIESIDMLYFNWEVEEDAVDPLQETLNLPQGFNIAKISILQDETPKYYLSLNFYKVEIAGVETFRTEWSTYVTKGDDPKPRFMVIQVQSSEDTSDPTNPPLFTLPAVDVSYTIDENGQVFVSSPDFQAAFALPNESSSHPQGSKTGSEGSKSHPNGSNSHLNGSKSNKRGEFADCQWAEANDALFYVNGIADTALYNGGLFDSPLTSIDPMKVQIMNDSPWVPFIKDTPSNVFQFQQLLEFAFTPYFNLNDPSFNAEYSAALDLYRSITFGAFSYGHAFSVLGGLAEPFLRFNVKTDMVPSTFVNFNIRDVIGLENLLGLPPGFKIAKSRMTPNQPKKFLLTLNIYESPDFLTGQNANRAEWSIYVHDTNDPTADRSYIMIIDVESSNASLDPVNLGTPPNAGFVYTRSAEKVSADIPNKNTEQNKFKIHFDMPSPTGKTKTLLKEWILSNDRIYWLNGVYDRLFYNGQFLDPDLAEVDLKTVSIDDGTPWAEFIDDRPLQVLVIRSDLQYVVYPWNNVEELCGANMPPAP